MMSTESDADYRTDQIYLRDAYRQSVEATVVGVRDDAVALNQTVFYATGGGHRCGPCPSR